VLYVGGWSRSGSTLLDLAAGSLPGAVSTGELRHLWNKGLQQGRLCGCGVPVPECDHWRAVLAAVGGYPDPAGPLDPAAVVADQRAVARTRDVPRLLRDGGDPVVRRLQGLVTRVCAAVAERSGAGVVVDSSKMPGDAALLATAPGVELHLVHLVRDPRAVAWSWQRPKLMTDLVPPRPIPPHSPAASTLQWASWNLLLERVGRRAASTTSVRYEDFAARPRELLSRLAGAVGLPPDDAAALVGDGTIRIRPAHTVAGNPARFDTGIVAVRVDDAWMRDQPRRHRWTATVLAAPLLRRYGYPLLARPR